MKRRTLLKCFLVVAGGTAVLPSCLHKESKASILLKNLSVTAEEETMLAEFAETLIPATATPGAKDTYSHLFALRMLDDCSEKEEQQAFIKGLKAVEEMVQANYKTSFTKATPAQRAAILTLLENKKGTADAQAFYKQMKNLTIQGYLTSKPVMGDIFRYELVPGRYNAAFPVKTIIRQA
jgi:hypothetical protein